MTDITGMGIMPMLAAILGGDTSEGVGPSTRMRYPEKQLGLITSPVSRRLFAAHNIMTEHVIDLVDEHNGLHAAQNVDHDCENFGKKVMQKTNRITLLNELFRQSVTEEHPAVAANDAGIRRGWLVVGIPGKWKDIVPVSDKECILNNFISRLKDIVCGKILPVYADRLEPVTEGEKVLGILDDKRAQRVWSLMMQIRSSLSLLVPAGFIEEDKTVIGKMTYDEIYHLSAILEHHKRLIDVTNDLFWRGVRDSMPEIPEIPGLGIQRDWTIVKKAPVEQVGKWVILC